MKIRSGFVSNSSNKGFDSKGFDEMVEKFKEIEEKYKNNKKDGEKVEKLFMLQRKY